MRKLEVKLFFSVSLLLACGEMASPGQEVPGAPATNQMLAPINVSSTTLGAAFSLEQFWNGSDCPGQNVSPDLNWTGAPDSTKSFAVTLFDNDARGGAGLWHWVAYNIPVGTVGFSPGAMSTATLPAGTVEGNTGMETPGYFGPCPRVGRKNTYTFTVYALKVEKLELSRSASADFIVSRLKENALGEGTLSATAGPRTK